MTTADFENETWEENGQEYQQIVGKSGVYLVITDMETGEVVRDDRPWQMKEGVS